MKCGTAQLIVIALLLITAAQSSIIKNPHEHIRIGAANSTTPATPPAINTK